MNLNFVYMEKGQAGHGTSRGTRAPATREKETQIAMRFAIRASRTEKENNVDLDFETTQTLRLRTLIPQPPVRAQRLDRLLYYYII